MHAAPALADTAVQGAEQIAKQIAKQIANSDSAISEFESSKRPAALQ